MSRRALTVSASLVALAVSACGVPLDELARVSVNECESAADCGAGATCASAGADRLCVATQAEMSNLILEVRPPQTAKGGSLSGASYLLEPGLSFSGVAASGHAAQFDPQLPPSAELTGVILYGGAADATYGFDCFAPDKSLHAEVLFRRAPPFAGLPSAEYVATTELVLDDMGAAKTFALSATLPPGTYDIYVTPLSPEWCVDKMMRPKPAPPPHFAGRHALQGAQGVSISLPETKHLTGNIEVNTQFDDIDGWELSLLEPWSGLPISTVQQIAQPDLPISATFDLGFHFPLLPPGGEGQGPIIRLRPAAPATSPALYWDLLTADFGNDLDVALSPGTLDDASRELDMQVLGADGEPVVSSVILQATSVDGDMNNVSFQVLAETDEDGWFHAEVYDGKYQVFARPKIDGPDAIGHAEIDSIANGSSIELQEKTHVQATVSTPTGELLYGGEAVANPSVPKPTNTGSYLTSALATASVEPRPDTASISSGALALLLDPGTYDVSVKPAPGSGYPWLVLPRLTILDGETATDIGALDMGFPVVVFGVLRDATGAPMPNTTLRAWVPVGVDPDAEQAGTVVQIAETTTSSDGSYVLTLPATIND